MDIFNWFNKILGINNSTSNINLPTKFELPSENIVSNNDFEQRYFTDMFDEINNFEESMKIFHSSLGEMFRHFEFDYPNDNENINNFFFFNNSFHEKDNMFNQSPNINDYNSIPKKNLIARNYFINTSPLPIIVNEIPISVKSPPGVHFEQSNSKSYISGQFNGKTIIKEISTKKLHDGCIEKLIVMRDGNQQCITTITENLLTGEQNCNKQLINLDESELNEFEIRFSKFK